MSSKISKLSRDTSMDNGIDTVLANEGYAFPAAKPKGCPSPALYSESELNFFDEATSSRGMKNERSIHETILSLREKVTMIIVASRLSMVENCDAVIWLDKSSVQMAGKAEDALAIQRGTERYCCKPITYMNFLARSINTFCDKYRVLRGSGPNFWIRSQKTVRQKRGIS